MKPALAALLPEELATILAGRSSYRTRQLFQWLQKGCIEIGEMHTLPMELRSWLAEHTVFPASEVVERRVDADGTTKLVIRLQDDAAVETVLLTDREGRRTGCLSTQVGCAMGCRFCRTGQLGFRRDLAAHEIVEQLLHLQAMGLEPANVVFMGMGEPLMNLDAVRKAVQVFHHPEGQNLGHRRITISTCGLPAGIRSLADVGPPVRLAVSLVTAREAVRRELMPVAGRYGLDELASALAYYRAAGGRRITLEVILIGGHTDTDEDAAAVAKYARPLGAHVNLIPWNPVVGMPFTEPSPERTARFAERLEQAGIPVNRRYRRGRGVQGACGQLGVAPSGGLEHGPDPTHAG